MTAPAPAGASTAYVIAPAAGRVPIADASAPPVGLTLVYTGVNGGTVWVSAGPNGGAALPLGPGATMTWQDAGAYPYAYLTTGATLPETVVVTNQASDYANPTTVAAALAVQGIPSTFLGNVVWSANPTGDPAGIALAANGGASPTLDVSRYNSLIVSVLWFTRDVVGPAAAFFDFVYGSFTGMGNSVNGPDSATFTLPVIGPTLRIVNRASAMNGIVVYGSNRPAPSGRLEHVRDAGIRQFAQSWSGTPTYGVIYDLNAVDGGSNNARLGGQAHLVFSAGGAANGVLFVDSNGPFGGTQEYPLAVNSTFGQQFTIGTPSESPTRFRYRCDTSPPPVNFTVGLTVAPG